MQFPLQKCWQILMIPILGVFLANSQVAAQSSAADLISADSPLNLLSDGGFESAVPSYWEPSGDGAGWTTDMARTPEYSLMLTGSGEASWTMAEAVRNWVPAHPADGVENPEIIVGGWVYTDGVNTSPTTDAEKFQLVFQFFKDATQTENVLGEDVVIDVPQDVASSSGWVEITNE